MATKTNIEENYKGKLFCVSTTRYLDGGEPSFTVFPKLYVNISSAMEKVASIVNETLACEKKKKRVKPMTCTDALHGGYAMATGDGSLLVHITVFDRPWSVQYMDCDNMQHSVELFPDKESAEIAVVKQAKAAIKEMWYDTPEFIYADRGGDGTTKAKDIKKSESYIVVDTLGGNHIVWMATQI